MITEIPSLEIGFELHTTRARGHCTISVRFESSPPFSRNRTAVAIRFLQSHLYNPQKRNLTSFLSLVYRFYIIRHHEHLGLRSAQQPGY